MLLGGVGGTSSSSSIRYSGGSGIGGNGGNNVSGSRNGTNGTDGTGSGGGGSGGTGNSGKGGSGIVIIKYLKEAVSLENENEKKLTISYTEQNQNLNLNNIVAYYNFNNSSSLGIDSNPSSTKYNLTPTIVGGTGGYNTSISVEGASFQATNDGDYLEGSFPIRTIYDNSTSGISVSCWFYKKIRNNL